MVAFLCPPPLVRQASVAALDVVFNGTSAVAPAAITHSHTVPIGSPSAGRIVLLSLHWFGIQVRTVQSVTINGVSATLVIPDGTGGGSSSGFCYAMVPNGTTATVVITFNIGASRSQVGSWSITGYSQGTPYAYSTPPGAAAAAAMTATVSALSGGVVIFISNGNTSGSWSGGVDLVYSLSATDLPTAARRNVLTSGTSSSTFSSARSVSAISWI